MANKKKKLNIHRLAEHIMWISFAVFLFRFFNEQFTNPAFSLTNIEAYRSRLIDFFIFPFSITVTAFLVFISTFELSELKLEEIEWRVTSEDGSLDTVVTGVNALSAINKFTNEYLPSELSAEKYLKGDKS